MKKRNLYYITILVLVIISVLLFPTDNKEVIYNKADNNAIATVQTLANYNKEAKFPELKNSFIAFKEALAFKESRGDYNCVNTLGYLGKYQFGSSTLRRFKIYSKTAFLNDSELQEDAFVALCSVNKWILRKDIKRKVGKKMNGVMITESGILAASHLAGAGNVKKYLRSNGTENFKDAYGSNIAYYLKKFAGYDTSHIPADKRAKI